MKIECYGRYDMFTNAFFIQAKDTILVWMDWTLFFHIHSKQDTTNTCPTPESSRGMPGWFSD